MPQVRFILDFRPREHREAIGDDYIDGASERIGTAFAMYAAYRFVDAIYLAGVAVECVLRAFASEENAAPA